MSLSTEAIWEEFSQELRQFLRRRVPEEGDAEDLLQEVFVKIHTRLDTLQDSERLGPWLYRIARNTVYDYYRKRKSETELDDQIAIEPEPFEAEPAARIAAGLKGMMECLPEKYREAVILAELDGVRQVDLAGQLGLSVSGAKSRVQRGREMLRLALLECCHFEFDRRGGIIDYSARPECCQVCRDNDRS